MCLCKTVNQKGICGILEKKIGRRWTHSYDILKERKNAKIIKKPRELRNVSYYHYSYGDCKDISKSTMEEVHNIGGEIMICKSKRQKNVMQ